MTKEQAKRKAQQVQAQQAAQSFKRVERLRDVGRAENQPITLTRRTPEERAEYLEGKYAELLAENATLKKGMAAFCEALKDGNTAHIMALRGDIVLTRAQLLHLLGDEEDPCP